MQKVIVFGITDLAEVMVYHLEHDSRYSISAITADREYLKSKTSDVFETSSLVINKYPVIPFERIKQMYPTDEYGIFLCVGYSNMNLGRKKTYLRIKEYGYNVLSYYHPTSLIQSEEIGEGSLFFENTTVGPYCKVGRCNIFYPCSHLAHHSKAGDYNFFAISCSIAGHVTIGNNCFFGNNSTTKNGINIADKTLCGAGTYLSQDTLEEEVFVPTRSLKLCERKSVDLHI